MIDLATVNLALDVIVKLVFLGLLVFAFIVLRNINRTLKSAGESAESVKETAERAMELFTLKSAYSIFKGRKSKKSGDEDDE